MIVLHAFNLISGPICVIFRIIKEPISDYNLKGPCPANISHDYYAGSSLESGLFGRVHAGSSWEQNSILSSNIKIIIYIAWTIINLTSQILFSLCLGQIASDLYQPSSKIH